jgi:hypothetical protein
MSEKQVHSFIKLAQWKVGAGVSPGERAEIIAQGAGILS